MPIDLSPELLERYRRNILLPQLGRQGQEKICNGRVLVVGAGGLGSAVAFYLAAAGIGTLGIVDSDCVELSNLQRQIIHAAESLGVPKTESARRSLRELNASVRVVPYRERFDEKNAYRLVAEYDFVVDCSDNFQTKFLINDACVNRGIGFSHAGVVEFFGQTMTVLPGKSACYRCVFQAPPQPSIPPGGILGAVAGMLGTIQATETIKFISGIGELLVDALLTIDTLTMTVRKIRVRRSPLCTACGAIR
jgi:molybdopterin/thiamine biosynthesis adenylyltransferase